MGSPNIALIVTHVNGRPHCAIRGEIDIITAPTIGQALTSFIDIGETAIDLDLSQVEFIDSRGIHELIVARRAGLRITITDASPAARRTLDVASINGYLSE
jgi:anti-anti-sigma factor